MRFCDAARLSHCCSEVTWTFVRETLNPPSSWKREEGLSAGMMSARESAPLSETPRPFLESLRPFKRISFQQQDTLEAGQVVQAL